MEISVSPAADLDLDELSIYIAKDSPAAARRLIVNAFKAFDDLLEMPRMGPAYPVRNRKLKGLRKWRVPGFSHHLIFYRSTDDGIEIVRVIHSARDIPRVLEEET